MCSQISTIDHRRVGTLRQTSLLLFYGGEKQAVEKGTIRCIYVRIYTLPYHYIKYTACNTNTCIPYHSNHTTSSYTTYHIPQHTRPQHTRPHHIIYHSIPYHTIYHITPHYIITPYHIPQHTITPYHTIPHHLTGYYYAL